MRIVTKASSFQKIICSKETPFKCIRKQNLTSTLSRSVSTKDHHLNILGMLHTKSQGHMPSGSGVEDFKSVLP